MSNEPIYELRHQLRRIRCLFGHDWDYFFMTCFNGAHEHYRCCLRCEKSEFLNIQLPHTGQPAAEVTE